MKLRRLRPSPAMVVALLALVVAVGGRAVNTTHPLTKAVTSSVTRN